jgi:hypothetical protein
MARLRKHLARVVQMKNLIERFIQLMKQDSINETSINIHNANRRAEERVKAAKFTFSGRSF